MYYECVTLLLLEENLVSYYTFIYSNGIDYYS